MMNGFGSGSDKAMIGDEYLVCYMCQKTEADQGNKMVWMDWMMASLCDECLQYFGGGDAEATEAEGAS